MAIVLLPGVMSNQSAIFRWQITTMSVKLYQSNIYVASHSEDHILEAMRSLMNLANRLSIPAQRQDCY